ncbi:MAG: hypothetical protein ABSB81_06610 [Halobacteriota archaeon]
MDSLPNGADYGPGVGIRVWRGTFKRSLKTWRIMPGGITHHLHRYVNRGQWSSNDQDRARMKETIMVQASLGAKGLRASQPRPIAPKSISLASFGP